MSRMSLTRRISSNEKLYGMEVEKNQYIGYDINYKPCIYTMFITKDNMTIVKCRDYQNKSWINKYIPIDSNILPIDIIQQLWVKHNRFLRKSETA